MIVTNIKNSTAAGMVIYQKIGKALLLTLLLGMATIAKAQTNAERPGLFYAVTGNGLRDTSWLFGTYHLVNSGYLDDKLGIQSAFNRAKGVVVEIVMDEAGMKAAQNKGMMQGQTAQQLLGQSFSDSLDAELKKEMGIGLAAMNQLKPMNIMLGLTITYTMKQSGSLLQQYKGQPIDLSFVQEAKKMSKPVHPLETVEQQMDVLFANLTEAEQAWQLKLFLRNKTSVQQSINELLAAWLRQDAAALYRLYEESRQLYATSATFDQALNKDRNNRWMLQLPGLLAQGPQFVAVGALHLIGPDGLVSQLQQKGYTVIPIKP